MEEENTQQEWLLKGKRRMLHLLERKEYSRKEITEHLKKEGYTKELIEQLLAYADRFHYLDDIRVAGNYIRIRKGKKSKKELEYQLKQKGISEEDIAIALEENYEKEDGISQEEIAISNFLEKYHVTEDSLSELSYKEKQKIAAKLYRKGFPQELIRKTLLL